MATPIELTALDEALLALDSDNAMLLSEFDGLCAGLAVIGSESVPTEDWLDAFWGGDKPKFDSVEDEQRLIGSLKQHLNKVARDISPPDFACAPIFEEDPFSNGVLWEVWASGFHRASYLNKSSWFAIADHPDKDVFEAFALMLHFCEIADGMSDLSQNAKAGLSLLAPEAIPLLVARMTAGHRGVKMPTGPREASVMKRAAILMEGRKIGRNEPCPCGSGKKYKQCCGK